MKNISELEEALFSKKDLDTYLQENKKSFTNESFINLINKHLKQKELKRSDLFKKSNIYIRYGYNIFNGSKTPSRNNVLRLSLGLNLSVDEANELLYSCEQSQLYAKSARDSIIMFSLANEYTVLQCNDELFKHGEMLI